MASNPLLGSRISLISKKNIRYEGTLYSINEADSTVALQDVKSFGTEGRELLDATGSSTFVPPNDQVHAYLLFRGQDIKDLHVHEKTIDVAPKPVEAAAVAHPPAPTTAAATVTPPPAAPTAARSDAKAVPPPSQAPAPALAKAASKPAQNESSAEEKKEVAAEKRPARSQKNQQQQQQGEKTKGAPTSKSESEPLKSSQSDGTGIGESKEIKPAPPKTSSSSGGANRKNQNMVGMGASLLNRKARGAKGDKELTVDGEFDFESNLAEFDKVNISDERDDDNDDDDEGNEGNEGNDAYSKDDFFDKISSEATDRINGIDNRLRGAAERNLNLDTFGAVSLGNQHGRRRYHGGRDGGRDGGRGGRGWRGGRGRGRGRGGGRGRDGGNGGGYQGNRVGGGDGAIYNNTRHEQGSGPAPRQNNRWKEMSSTSAY